MSADSFMSALKINLFVHFSFPGFSRLRMQNKGGFPVAFVEYQVSCESHVFERELEISNKVRFLLLGKFFILTSPCRMFVLQMKR